MPNVRKGVDGMREAKRVYTFAPGDVVEWQRRPSVFYLATVEAVGPKTVTIWVHRQHMSAVRKRVRPTSLWHTTEEG